MARPRLRIGEHGKIHLIQSGKVWKSRCSYRDTDGRVREATASGPTRTKAEQALKDKILERRLGTGSEITPDTPVLAVAEHWLSELNRTNRQGKSRLSPGSITTYTSTYNSLVKPRVTHLVVRECTVYQMEWILRDIEESGRQANLARIVLKSIIGIAVRYGALTANTVRDTSRPLKSTPAVVSMTPRDAERIRAVLEEHDHTDMADVFEMLLATGARIGEILALRWEDIDIQAATVHICGHLVHVKGQGLARLDGTKRGPGRIVHLPPFAVAMLRSRWKNRTHTVTNAVFPSRKGTWWSPNNFRRTWRELRASQGLEWVTPKTYRKTVATTIARASDGATSARVLGNSERVAEAHYIERDLLTPDMTGALEAFAAQTVPKNSRKTDAESA